MIHFRIHVPRYIELTERQSKMLEGHYESPADILTLDTVQVFTRDPEFYQLSQMIDSPTTTLMAEYDQGRRWLVVGYAYEIIEYHEEDKRTVYRQVDFKLPEWKPNYEAHDPRH